MPQGPGAPTGFFTGEGPIAPSWGGGGAHDKVVTSEATTGKSGHAKSPKVILSERDRGPHEPESPTLDSHESTSQTASRSAQPVPHGSC